MLVFEARESRRNLRQPVRGVLQNSSQESIRLRNVRGEFDGPKKLGHRRIELSLPVKGDAESEFDLRAFVEHLARILKDGSGAREILLQQVRLGKQKTRLFA